MVKIRIIKTCVFIHITEDVIRVSLKTATVHMDPRRTNATQQDYMIHETR